MRSETLPLCGGHTNIKREFTRYEIDKLDLSVVVTQTEREREFTRYEIEKLDRSVMVTQT